MGDSQYTGVHHVVAGLLVVAGTVLLCHRSANRAWYPNVWDLPGGHIEHDETPPVALVRELHEELGILIVEPIEPAFAHLQRPEFDCQIWVVKEWNGTPHIESLVEHDDMRWWPLDAIGDLPLADKSYRALIEKAVSQVGG